MNYLNRMVLRDGAVRIPHGVFDSLGSPDTVVLFPCYDNVDGGKTGYIQLTDHGDTIDLPDKDVQSNFEPGRVCRVSTRRKIRLDPELLGIIGCEDGENLVFITYRLGKDVHEIWSSQSWKRCDLSAEDAEEYENVIKKLLLRQEI